MQKIEIFDTTLRDGAQSEGISYTLQDKISIAQALDRLSIDYIEAGTPFSNPKDMDFFKNPPRLTHAKLVAFGMTRRKDCRVEEDDGIKALLSSGAGTVSVVGKASASQVREILKTTQKNNLAMVYDTVHFLKEQGREVFFDAEHFFDGWKQDASYAADCIKEAARAGADRIILCDTNGGTFPDEIASILTLLAKETSVSTGIHCHNDCGCAVAGAIAAVKAGCVQVQGTYLGFGERCGNTNLSALIPSLQLKLHYSCIDEEKMKMLTKTARVIAETSNIRLEKWLPYVGESAFSHKGGMHVDGVNKDSSSFEQIEPALVGNRRHILISEMAGRAAMLSVIHEVDPSITKNSVEAKKLTDSLKEMESKGYQFETASASLELLIAKKLDRFRPFFHLLRFRVIGEQGENGQAGISTAMIKIRVGEETEVSAAEGEGPVHALDKALKKAVLRFYPSVECLRLMDYKVRVLESSDGAAAAVRVLITSGDGQDVWTTVGVSRDIIEASVEALIDSVEYLLMKEYRK